MPQPTQPTPAANPGVVLGDHASSAFSLRAQQLPYHGLVYKDLGSN